MPNTSIQELINGGEQLGVEFKGAGSLKADKRLRAQVVRAILGMANRRDGGLVIVGLDAAPGRSSVPGIDPADLPSWDPDHVSDAVAPYADPSVRLEARHEAFAGKVLVVITVAEFEDVPVICKKAYDDVLEEGALYVRGRRKPETTRVRTQADMRDLVDLAVEKQLRSVIGMVERAGLRIGRDGPTDAEAFKRQAEDL